jgi:hypothetical protein
MRKWKGDPLMTAQDLSRKSGEYRKRAFIAEVEALKKESACSAEALDAYAERALNGGFKPLTREEQAKAKAAAERAAREAGKAARDRVLILAGYDPMLPLNPAVEADLRSRQHLAGNPARGYPTASPLAAGDPPPLVDSCSPPCDPGNWATEPAPPDMKIPCCQAHCKDNPEVLQCERLEPNAQCCAPWHYIKVEESALFCTYTGYCCDPGDPQSPCCTDPETGQRCSQMCSKTECSRSYVISNDYDWVCGAVRTESLWAPGTVSGTCWNCGPTSCRPCVISGYTKCPGGGDCDYGDVVGMEWSKKSEMTIPCVLRMLTCEIKC